jgi:Concanavalin A-like lectin/glucanases superfamily
MKRILVILFVTMVVMACNLPGLTTEKTPVPPREEVTEPLQVPTELPLVIQSEYPENLVAYYPLTADLNDATGKNAPLSVQNAMLIPDVGLFSNGIHTGSSTGGSVITTPELSELTLDAFTISVQFNVPDQWDNTNPVFVGGDLGRWVIYKLMPDGSIKLGYNNSQAVDCTVTYQLNTWHEAIITFDGQTLVLYLDKVEGCRVTTALETYEAKTILQVDYANGTSFYGTIREERVYNGVVPVEEIPFP